MRKQVPTAVALDCVRSRLEIGLSRTWLLEFGVIRALRQGSELQTLDALIHAAWSDLQSNPTCIESRRSIASGRITTSRSHSEIAAILGLDRRTTLAHLRTLEAYGWLKRDRLRGRAGVYELGTVFHDGASALHVDAWIVALGESLRQHLGTRPSTTAERAKAALQLLRGSTSTPRQEGN